MHFYSAGNISRGADSDRDGTTRPGEPVRSNAATARRNPLHLHLRHDVARNEAGNDFHAQVPFQVISTPCFLTADLVVQDLSCQPIRSAETD